MDVLDGFDILKCISIDQQQKQLKWVACIFGKYQFTLEWKNIFNQDI